jgi:hypothetical protein
VKYTVETRPALNGLQIEPTNNTGEEVM